ncbi:MAG: spoIIE [Haloplasmataceae bacterium]|nr:spoIIE [Haloplasmataceae bacterium]
MSQTLVAINEKINKQIKEEKSVILTKSTMNIIGFVLLFSLLSLTINFKLGAFFMLPILCTIIIYNKKVAYILMFCISFFSFLIDMNLSLSVIVAFIPLSLLIHSDNKKSVNFMLLVLISLISYYTNVILGLVEFSILKSGYVSAYNLFMYNLYYNAIEINKYNKNKRDFLFKEEIIAIISTLICLLLCLFTLNVSFINLGYVVMIFSIMTLGLLTNKTNTLGFSIILYLVIRYSGLSLYGMEVIPFIGLISAFAPKNNIYMKTLLTLMVAPTLFYLNKLDGDVINILLSLSISSLLFFAIGTKISKKYLNILIPKYEEAKYYQIYVENFREDISQRLLNFAELFDAFASKSLETNNQLMKVDEAIDELVDKHCKGCLKKDLCHNSNYIKTYNYFSQILKEGDEIFNSDKKRFLDLFGMFCLNSIDIINSAIELHQEYLLSAKKEENNNVIFQSQLHGLSKILQNFAIEVNTDYENETIKVEKLRDKLMKVGINISYLKVNSSKKKNLDIDIGIRNYNEELNPMISKLVEEIFKEEIEIVLLKKGKIVNKLKVISKQIFDLDFGTSYIGKDGSRISGDNFLKCDMHNGNMVVALSDGMGNGYSAHIESKSTLELLNRMLQTGADDHTAVSIINTLVSLKEYNERFSTLDYITINKSLGTIDFYKIGSAPSFIIRGNKVIRINNDNLPIGTQQKVEKITFDLEINDIIIIVSDGVVERFNNMNKFEKIIMQIIRTSSIQMAHDIIRAAITEFGGKIADDMTAIVIKVNNTTNKMSA